MCAALDDEVRGDPHPLLSGERYPYQWLAGARGRAPHGSHHRDPQAQPGYLRRAEGPRRAPVRGRRPCRAQAGRAPHAHHRARGRPPPSDPRTTVADRDAASAPDLVNRAFTAEDRDRLWVADITYVPTLAGLPVRSFAWQQHTTRRRMTVCQPRRAGSALRVERHSATSVPAPVRGSTALPRPAVRLLATRTAIRQAVTVDK